MKLIEIVKKLTARVNFFLNHVEGKFEEYDEKTYYGEQALKPQICTLDPDEPMIGLYPATYWYYEVPYFNYRHEPGEDFYTYMLLDIEDSEIGQYSNEIILTTTFTTAMPTTELFMGESGLSPIWDKEITIAAGDTWTFLIKNIGNAWHIYPMKEKMQ